MEVRLIGFEGIAEYMRVSIGFWVRERIDPAALPELIVHSCPPIWKDYDEVEEERPSSYPGRFEVKDWLVFGAIESGRLIGGAVVALRPVDYELSPGAQEAAVLVDIRVDAEFRGQRVGHALLAACISAAKEAGCRELWVETQDTNVPACRFYLNEGFELASVTLNAYEGFSDEAKVVLRMSLP
ncbi:MAG: GNAT family N-acetyltransferase [Armatimonadetes bacterium]|nr:GNAT family N-acetyltransferase [Armatimonadota bacterium]